MQDFVENNREKLIKTLGEVIKKHRQNQNKTIYSISAEASMSKSTWREAELGVCKDINLSTFWKIAEGLGISPVQLLIELADNLGSDFTLTELENN